MFYFWTLDTFKSPSLITFSSVRNRLAHYVDLDGLSLP